MWSSSYISITLCVCVCVPALAALSGRLLVLVVDLSEELGGFLLVPPHQLLQLFELTSLLLLINLRLLQTLHGARRDIWYHKWSCRIFKQTSVRINKTLTSFSGEDVLLQSQHSLDFFCILTPAAINLMYNCNGLIDSLTGCRTFNYIIRKQWINSDLSKHSEPDLRSSLLVLLLLKSRKDRKMIKSTALFYEWVSVL